MEKGGKLFSGSMLGKRGPPAAKGKSSDDGYGSRGRPFGSDGKGDYPGGPGPGRSGYGSYKGEERAPSYGSGYGSRPKGGDSDGHYRSGGGGKDSGWSYGGKAPARASGKPSYGTERSYGADSYGSSSPAYSSRAGPPSVFGRDSGKPSYGSYGAEGGKDSYGKTSYGRSTPYGAAAESYGGGSSYKGDGKRGYDRPAPRYGAEPDSYSPRGKGSYGKGDSSYSSSKGGKGYEYDSYSSFKGGDKGGGTMRAPMKGGEKGKGGGKAANKIAAGEEVYWGVIKSFNPEKKSGFIDCPALQTTVYGFQDVLGQTAPTAAGPGDRVAFFVHWSAKGQPQASRPLIKLKDGSGDGRHALKGKFRMANGKDFGFIDCAEAKEFWGRDVFVKQDIASGLQDGDMVSFNCFLNREGLPTVEEAASCDEAWEPREADLSVAKEVETGKGPKGAGKDKGKSFGGKDYGPPPSYGGAAFEKGSFGGAGKGEGKGGGQPEPTGRFCSGQIKSFTESKNYGFVECEEIKQEYGCDVFMHGKEFTERELQVGDYVSFEVGMNSRGQPQALDIRKEGTVEPQEPPAKKPKIEEANTPAPLAPGPLAGQPPATEGGEQQTSEEPPATEAAAPQAAENFSFSELLTQE